VKLEDSPNAYISGVIPVQSVRVAGVEWHVSEALTLLFRRLDGSIADQILYRSDESRLSKAEQSKPWRFDADGNDF